MCSLEDLHEGSKKLMLLQVTALGNEFEVRVGIAAIATNSSPSIEITLVLLWLALPHWSVLFIYLARIWPAELHECSPDLKTLLIPIHRATSEALNHSGSTNYGKFTLSAKRPYQIHRHKAMCVESFG
jgi:hypothetical protein